MRSCLSCLFQFDHWSSWETVGNREHTKEKYGNVVWLNRLSKSYLSLCFWREQTSAVYSTKPVNNKLKKYISTDQNNSLKSNWATRYFQYFVLKNLYFLLSQRFGRLREDIQTDQFRNAGGTQYWRTEFSFVKIHCRKALGKYINYIFPK